MNELWNKLESFRIGTGTEALSFVSRVARENRWTPQFAMRVYREYLRFLYLAASTDHAVTPSDAVDQVWHLHLCYTDSYWNELCPNVLERPLHHGPTRGGTQEDLRYDDQYRATLASYRTHFDTNPPEDIWPSPKVRFDPGNRFTRLNEKEVFIVRRSTLAMAACSVTALVLASGCESIQDGTWADTPFLIIPIIIGFFLIALFIAKRNGGGRGGCSTFGGGGGCGSDGGSGCGSGCGGGCGGS